MGPTPCIHSGYESFSGEDDLANPLSDIMFVERVKGKTYTCPILRPSKGKEKEHFEGKIKYSYDISECDQIFHYLLKDKQIQLLDDHKKPSP